MVHARYRRHDLGTLSVTRRRGLLHCFVRDVTSFSGGHSHETSSHGLLRRCQWRSLQVLLYSEIPSLCETTCFPCLIISPGSLLPRPLSGHLVSHWPNPVPRSPRKCLLPLVQPDVVHTGRLNRPDPPAQVWHCSTLSPYTHACALRLNGLMFRSYAHTCSTWIAVS